MPELTPEEKERVNQLAAEKKRKNALLAAKKRDWDAQLRKQRAAEKEEAAEPQAPAEPKKPVTSLQKELALRELARRKLIHFTKRFKPDYEAGWVHEDICRRLEKFFKEVEEKKSPRLMLFLPPRHGKQIADSTPVLTTAGWKTHGELTPGDFVFHPNGHPVEVLAVSGKTPSDMVVTLQNGEVVRCHENHEWTVYDRSCRTWRTVETRFLAEATKSKRPRKVFSGGRSLYQLPAVAPLEFSDAQLSMHPYVLGAWLGDGSSSKPAITHTPSETEVISAVAGCGYPVSAVCRHPVTGVLTTYFSGPRAGVSGRMTKELQALDLVNNKHIPENYKMASIQQRLELLAGLVDTDGHVERRTGRVRIATASQRLAEDIVEVAETLGFRPYVFVSEPALSTSGIQGTKPVYYVGFQPTLPVPTQLPRKRIERFAPRRRIGITSVKREPNGDQGHCVQIDSPDGLYLVGRKLTPTHNSELASINFPAWALGHRPEFEIIAGSYAVSLPEKFSRIVQQKLRDPAYKAMFPSTYINSKNQGIEAWTTTNGGGYVAAGVGGGITGKGAHILILDDTTKDAEEADSENQRKKVWDWYGSTAYTRLAPGGGVLVIMTRWHDDDLAGRALTQQKDNIKAEVPVEEIDAWEVVQYPAIATQNEYQDVESGEILYLNGNTGEYTNLLGYVLSPSKKPRLLRRKGEALHEARFPEADLKRIQRSLQPRHWSALYQQNPVPDEGVYFTKTMFRTSPTPSLSDMDIYIAWDLAIGEKQTNDWTVGVVGGLDEHDQLHILDVVRFRGDTYAIAEAILNTYKKWKPELVGAEKGVIELAIMPVLKKMMSKQRTYISFDDELKPVNDKMKRARPLQGRMQQGVIFFPENNPEWYEVLKHEFLRFPGGLHDDIVDAAAWLCKMVLKRTPPRPKGRQRRKSWRDKVKGMTRGTKHPMMA